ncbi:DUF4259 domain-containing protein [Glycomyces albidus]|jgi:hypothetical protein|uniref:DUF4259 domain-containing protein n=1 Tax=Glycomyces albidus TaxID=2656774 RepID=A0A6L5G472_9ACTN|nr:DUF4259 domain-containing protein [Glycomyces albidus]MQM24437.1 DUF4259 domain-containing protein [Glycomyces albidus]
MGAWDYGPFDNDGAWDCLDALTDDADANTAHLRSAMIDVLDETEYLESPECQGAVGAAVLTAMRLGAPSPGERATEVLDAHPFDAEALRATALRTLKRVTDDPADNEWYDLWLDAGSLDKVLAIMAPYRETLEGGGAEAR